MGARAPCKSFVGKKWQGGGGVLSCSLGHFSIRSEELKQWARAAFVPRKLGTRIQQDSIPGNSGPLGSPQSLGSPRRPWRADSQAKVDNLLVPPSVPSLTHCDTWLCWEPQRLCLEKHQQLFPWNECSEDVLKWTTNTYTLPLEL